MTDTILEINDLTKTFQNERNQEIEAIRKVSFSIQSGEFICILGPSGCGKSTLLRIIAGLEQPTSGTLQLNYQTMLASSPDQKSKKHRTSMVFQEFALFPWLSVRKNIEFGLELRNKIKEEKRGISDRLIQIVGLEGFENSYPHELSGGMKQRVAIARALAVDPQLLLMDEPFGSLDAQTRGNLQEELLSIWDKTGKTFLFVTHSAEESIFLADRILVMTQRPGSVKQIFKIPFSRLRDRTSHYFNDLRHEILEAIKV